MQCQADPETLQGEGLLHKAAAAVGLASDKAQETKEAAKQKADETVRVLHSACFYAA
jgi:hypothetical protein